MRGQAGAAVNFREIIRAEIHKQMRAVDQVSLGTVAGAGAEPEVLLDGMPESIPVMWAGGQPAAVGQRVVLVALRGGQEYIVVGVIEGGL